MHASISASSIPLALTTDVQDIFSERLRIWSCGIECHGMPNVYPLSPIILYTGLNSNTILKVDDENGVIVLWGQPHIGTGVSSIL
jgi:hypothetical protein